MIKLKRKEQKETREKEGGDFLNEKIKNKKKC